MSSKAYLYRHKSVDEVTSLLDTRSAEAARGLEELFAPDLEDGETMPDFEGFLKLLRRALTRRLGELAEADDEWAARREEETQARGTLKKTAGAWRRRLNKLRMYLRGLFNHHPVPLRSVLSGELPRDPVGLLAATTAVFAWVEDCRLEPGLEMEGPPVIAESAKKRVAAVSDAVDSLNQAEAARVHANSRRQEVLEVFNESFVDLVDLVHVLYLTAGVRDASPNLRASRQEKGLKVGVVKRRRAAHAAHAGKDEK